METHVCPGEGCQYGKWVAKKASVLYDTWKPSQKMVAEIHIGDSVVSDTGLVVTARPGRIILDHDLPDDGLRKGDEVFIYTYRGEGYAAAWAKGRYYHGLDVSFAWPDNGDRIWWAHVQLANGLSGWVDMRAADFSGMCALAAIDEAN